MKKLLLLIITTVLTLALYAQNQYATTIDGRKVLLKSNGTWEYVKGENTSAKDLSSGGNMSATSNASSSRNNNNTSNNRTSSSSSPKKSTGRTYITGPRGGCYYINGNGNKTYVDRSFCK